MAIIEFTIPMQLTSPNSYTHHMAAYNDNKKKAKKLWAIWKINNYQVTLPCEVTITRIAPRQYDGDNLVSSCKGLRDAISALIRPGMAPGRADGTDQIKWHYAQEKGKIREYSVRIKIEY